MKEIRIDLNDKCRETITELERLDYEVVIRERLLSRAYTMDSFLADTSKFQPLLDEYSEAFIKFDKCREAFYRDYVKHYADENPEIRGWSLDYISGCLILYDYTE